MKKIVFAFFLFLCVFSASFFCGQKKAYASGIGTDALRQSAAVSVNLNLTVGGDSSNPQQTSAALQILLLVSIIAIAPSILLMMTCFPRFLISLHFLRSALGTQQMPPNQIIIALALFLTVFLMRGELTQINDNALKPFAAGTITQDEAITEAMKPIRSFMFKYVTEKDVGLFQKMTNSQNFDINNLDTIPNEVLIPAFMIGELTKGFIIGVFIYIPFIVIDMVVASTLMAMGMMMLPPAMISLPFKIILFVLVDGWNLVIARVFETFAR